MQQTKLGIQLDTVQSLMSHCGLPAKRNLGVQSIQHKTSFIYIYIYNSRMHNTILHYIITETFGRLVVGLVQNTILQVCYFMPNREFGVDSLYAPVFVTFSPAEKQEETIHKRLGHNQQTCN